jgi:hypothetical protein
VVETQLFITTGDTYRPSTRPRIQNEAILGSPVNLRSRAGGRGYLHDRQVPLAAEELLGYACENRDAFQKQSAN